jgi:hypothetical protein
VFDPQVKHMGDVNDGHPPGRPGLHRRGGDGPRHSGGLQLLDRQQRQRPERRH